MIEVDTKNKYIEPLINRLETLTQVNFMEAVLLGTWSYNYILENTTTHSRVFDNTVT